MTTTPPEQPEQPDQPDRPPAGPDPEVGGSEQRPTSLLAVLGLIFAFVFAPVGIVLSALGLKETRSGAKGGRGLALAGLVASCVVTVLGIGALIALGVLAVGATQAVRESVTATAPPVPTLPPSATVPDADDDGSDGTQLMSDDITILDCTADPATSTFSAQLRITNSADSPASYAIQLHGYTDAEQLAAWASADVDDLAPGATTEVTVDGATFDTTTPVTICRLEGTFRSSDG